MRVYKALIVLGLVGAAIPAGTASAANSPSFRDCSFIGGIDPDFVQLSGATPGSGGTLTVPQSQKSVTVLASESSDPGDNTGHDTFTVTVAAPGVASQTVSGMGVGSVTLTVPLSGAAVGSAYTITWHATFDNGVHACPGSATPQNLTANPFVLNVVAGTAPPPPPPAPVLTRPRQSNGTWQLPGKTKHGHQLPVGTAFSFILNEQARVTLAFTQTVAGHRKVRRGTVTVAGKAGDNSISFKGRTSTGKLKPGKYTVVMTAKDSAGHSRPTSLRFTISK
jgi:hypothetical protein